MINHPELLSALASDYLNVYVLDVDKDEAVTYKLKGYVVKGIKDNKEGFSYTRFLLEYINTRVYPDDRPGLTNALSLSTIKATFADGREKIEVKYRVLEAKQIHYYSVVYIRLNEVGAPLRLLVAFRNVDEIISLERSKRHEGLYSAYEALSDLYLCMYRINVQTEEFKVIKDNEMANKFVHSKHWSDNFLEVLSALTTPDTKKDMGDFLNMSTLEERLKGKKRISHYFVSNPSKLRFRLSFIREDEDEEGRLLHVLYAVEMLEKDVYQSAFDIFAKEFNNVFRIDLSSGNAAILKSDRTASKEFSSDKPFIFPWDEKLSDYVEEKVPEGEKEALLEKVSLKGIKAGLEGKGEFGGSYHVKSGEDLINYHFDLFSTPEPGIAIACYRNVDSFFKEHLEQEKQEREREKERRKELNEQLAIFNSLSRGFRNIYLANLNDGTAKILKLDSDYKMEELEKLRKMTFPFEPTLRRWAEERVHPDDLEYVLSSLSLANLRKVFAKQEEFTGTYRSYEKGVLHHYQWNVSRADDSGTVICGFQMIDEMIEEHLQQEKERAEKEALIRKEQDEKNELIQAIATLYTTIFNVWIPSHRYEILTSVSLMGQVAKKEGVFDEAKESILKAFIAEDMKKEMSEFLNLDDLSQRLEKTNTVILEYRDPKGKWFEGRFIVKKRDEEGKAIEALYVAREVTAEKEQEMRQEAALRDALLLAQHASRAKTTFLNSMSHDIRTPMNAIIGFTALAETHLDNKEAVSEYLGKIHTSSAHLLSLINEILDMSRIESGVVKLDEAPVHLPDVLHDLRTMIQGQVSAKSQHLYVDTMDVVHEDVYTDKLRLNQVLLNIVGNAIKYTGVGGDVFIKVAERPSSAKGRAEFEFSVKDNGIGMSPEFKERVFEAFARERSSTVSGIQGTGLGMSITKNIVDLMGGEIKVESELGKGSEFTVKVSFRLAEAQTSREPIEELIGARALVVDDDVFACQSVAKLLRDIKMRPDWATSGREAIARAKEASEIKDEFKVYIVDYLMPDLNGIATIREIRKVIGEEPLMIILTAYDWSEVEEEAKEAGVTAFVSKPIFLSELRAVLSKEETIAEEEEEEAELHCEGKRVLLVEDNDLNREIATSLLVEMGFEVDLAKDGIEAINAIARAEEGRYSLIFMDIQMPRMDGYTATREIRTFKNNAKANIPIFAMTANAFEEDKQKAFEAGMNGHIAKPIDAKAIEKAIAPFLAK